MTPAESDYEKVKLLIENTQRMVRVFMGHRKNTLRNTIAQEALRQLKRACREHAQLAYGIGHDKGEKQEPRFKEEDDDA